MGISIFANNCSGWKMYQDLKLPYESPTIALQIMPEEFTKFCQNIDYYMAQDVKEYKDFSEYHKTILWRMFGYNVECPYGLCGDICIVFQHEKSFEEAKAKWNRRKARVGENRAFLFCLDYDQYQREAQEFHDAYIPNSYVFTNNFDIDGEHYRYCCLERNKICYLDKDRKNHYIFEGSFDRGKLWERN